MTPRRRKALLPIVRGKDMRGNGGKVFLETCGTASPRERPDSVPSLSARGTDQHSPMCKRSRKTCVNVQYYGFIRFVPLSISQRMQFYQLERLDYDGCALCSADTMYKNSHVAHCAAATPSVVPQKLPSRRRRKGIRCRGRTQRRGSRMRAILPAASRT